MAGAARDVVAIATAIGNICTAIEGHIVEKSTLKSLLKLYESRLKNNCSFIELGLQLRHCQPYAINAYDTIVCTGEWLASKHIKLTNASGGFLSRSRWKFPWKFAGKKRANFQFLLQQLRQDLDNLVDCIQSSGHVGILESTSRIARLHYLFIDT